MRRRSFRAKVAAWLKSAGRSRPGAAGLKGRRISSVRRSAPAAGVVVAPGTVHRAAQDPHVPSCQISGPHGLVAAGVMPARGRRGRADGQDRPAIALYYASYWAEPYSPRPLRGVSHRVVKGHQELPSGGREFCPLMATRSARWWPSDVPRAG